MIWRIQATCCGSRVCWGLFVLRRSVLHGCSRDWCSWHSFCQMLLKLFQKSGKRVLLSIHWIHFPSAAFKCRGSESNFHALLFRLFPQICASPSQEDIHCDPGRELCCWKSQLLLVFFGHLTMYCCWQSKCTPAKQYTGIAWLLKHACADMQSTVFHICSHETLEILMLPFLPTSSLQNRRQNFVWEEKLHYFWILEQTSKFLISIHTALSNRHRSNSLLLCNYFVTSVLYHLFSYTAFHLSRTLCFFGGGVAVVNSFAVVCVSQVDVLASATYALMHTWLKYVWTRQNTRWNSGLYHSEINEQKYRCVSFCACFSISEFSVLCWGPPLSI